MIESLPWSHRLIQPSCIQEVLFRNSVSAKRWWGAIAAGAVAQSRATWLLPLWGGRDADVQITVWQERLKKLEVKVGCVAVGNT